MNIAKKKTTKKKSTPKKVDKKKLPAFDTKGRGVGIGKRLNKNWLAIEARFSTKPKKPGWHLKKWNAELVATHVREYVDSLPFPDVPMLPDFLSRYQIPESTYYDLMEKDETKFLLESHTYLRNTCQTRLIIGALYEIFPHGAVRPALQSLGLAGSTEVKDMGRDFAAGAVGYFDELKEWSDEDRKIEQKKRMKKNEKGKPGATG